MKNSQPTFKHGLRGVDISGKSWSGCQEQNSTVLLYLSTRPDIHLWIYHWWVLITHTPHSFVIFCASLLAVWNINNAQYLAWQRPLMSLGSMEWNPSWQNPFSDKISQSHRTFHTILSVLRHLSKMGLFISATSNGWQCPTCSSVTSTSYLVIVVPEFFVWRFSSRTLHKFLSSCDLPVEFMASFPPVLEGTFRNSF